MDSAAAGKIQSYNDSLKYIADFESSFDGVSVIDREKRILYSNCANAKTYGYASKHELIGQRWHILCDDKEMKRLEDEIIPLIWKNGRWRGESIGRRRDGTRFHHEVSLTAIEGGKIVVVVRDLTEHKKTRNELFSLKKAVENMQLGVTITDMNRKILYVNQSEAQMHGYSVEELIGRDVGCFSPREKCRPIDMDNLIRPFRRESVNIRKDGSLFDVALMSDLVTDEAGQIINIVTTCEDITERRKSEEMIKHKAYYDDLTNLPNRLFFTEHLEQAISGARQKKGLIAVMFVDIDRFRNINDTLDHDAGDRLIHSVAQRLRCIMRSQDLVARLGGDEFLIMLPYLDSAQEAAFLATKVSRVMSQVFILNGHELHATVSIGISLYPNDGENVSTLIKNADTAMYCVKAQGRNSFQFYSLAMNAKNLEHLTMENNLHKALHKKELLLHYQPQVDLISGRVLSLEALMRWRHPDLGLISPNEFIPLAEETGIIVPIGEWLIYTACEQISAWRTEGFRLERIAVNLSMRQFKLTNLIDTIGKALARTGLGPNSLELEITESIIMQNPETTVATLRELSTMGIHLSIDDFGTGYSSLNYLKYLPLNKLKIAPNFAAGIGRDPNDEAICKAVITLAHSLGLKVIAEGVETAEQLEFLRTYECDEVQGYLFSRPLPAEEICRLLAEDGPMTPSRPHA